MLFEMILLLLSSYRQHSIHLPYLQSFIEMKQTEHFQAQAIDPYTELIASWAIYGISLSNDTQLLE